MNTPGLPADDPGPLIPDVDPGDPVLPDSGGGDPWWVPAPGLVTPAEGTFRFVYRHTGHDEDGTPTIAATVSAVLRFPDPPPGLRGAPRTALAVRLRVPFVDDDTGESTAVELPATVEERDGRVHCTVEVRGALARAVYGVLSTPGFQPGEQASFVVDLGFTAVQHTIGTFLPERLDGFELPELVRPWPLKIPVPFEPPPGPGDPEPIVTLVRRADRFAVLDVDEQGPDRRVALIDRAGLVDTGLTGPELIDTGLIDTGLVDTGLVDTGLIAGPADGVRMLRFDVPDFPVRGVIVVPRPAVVDTFTPIRIDEFVVAMAVAVTRRHRVPLLVPCRDHPDLYRRDPGDGSPAQVVGCQTAEQLGRIPARRFAPLPALDRSGRYAVWESLQQPATYLVVPAHYRVARTPGGRPDLQWIQVFDATQDVGQPCLLQAACVPDLTPVELMALRDALRGHGNGVEPRLLLPTSPSVGARGAVVGASTLDGPLRAVLDDDQLRVAMRVAYSDAVVAVAQLRGGQAVAQVVVECGDGEQHATTLHLDVAELAGPHPDGPLRLLAGPVVHNLADTPAVVTALWEIVGDGSAKRAPFDVPFDVAARGELALPAGTPGAVVEGRTADADAGQLAVRTVYLENLHTVVLVRRDVDLAVAGIVEMELAFHVSGVEVARTRLPAGAPLLEVTLVQPLVAGRSTLDRAVLVDGTITATDGSTRPLAPRTVDLAQGVVLPVSRLLGP